MARLGDILEEMRQNPAGVRFADAGKVCEHFFGPARQSGSSHMVFETPWPGDPRVNIQKGSGGRAKVYQIRQILAAIEKLTSHDKVST
ncbi:MAG: hypothetical protein OEL53_18570 [Rhodospirillales bacterium]|nr:hypothetical protein [Rhodospirillales bacterium]